MLSSKCIFTFKTFISRNLSLTCRVKGLEEFFDTPKNWGTASVASGRPWRLDELRRKSASDLHKLWYILLKERNMLMTTEEEHWRCLERMPNPERFEKVEESMENLLMVVEERDKAVAELEHGEWVGPKIVNDVDKLGRPVTRLMEEHLEPPTGAEKADDEAIWGDWTVKYLRLEREKHIRAIREKARAERFEAQREKRKRIGRISDEDMFEKVQAKLF